MRIHLLSLLLVCSLFSCVSTKIESNKLTGFDKKIERIYVKVKTTKETSELMQELQTELKTMFEARKIQVKSGKIRELDLGEDAARIQEEMAYFQPDLILSVQVDGSSKNFTYQPYGGAYYNESNRLTATLGNFPQDQPVWKAVLRSRSSIPGLGAHNIAKKIIERLEVDEFLAKQ